MDTAREQLLELLLEFGGTVERDVLVAAHSLKINPKRAVRRFIIDRKHFQSSKEVVLSDHFEADQTHDVDDAIRIGRRRIAMIEVRSLERSGIISCFSVNGVRYVRLEESCVAETEAK